MGGVIADTDRGRAGAPSARVGNARTTWHERHGLLVRLVDRDGLVGVGEASPLPGHSADNLDQCRAELGAIAWAEIAPVTAARVGEVTAVLTCPSVRFALDTALLDLIGQKSGLSMATLLASSEREPVQRVPINALISDVGNAANRASDARARGIECIKVKVGRPGRFADELAALRAIRDACGDQLSIRLDANQSWSAVEAASHLARLADIGPEYIEEPTGDLVGLLALGKPPIPLALDESLARGRGSVALDGLMQSGVVRALVIKPMLMGGLFCSLDWAARARAYGAAFVVSHLLGGPIELTACIQLAVALGGKDACGLDRHPGLTVWPEMAIPGLEAGYLTAVDKPGLGFDSAALRDQPSAAERS